MIFSLGRLAVLRRALISARMWFFRSAMGMEIHPTVRMSLSAKPDLSFPKGIHIAEYSYLAFNVRMLTHDFTRGLYLHTRVGRHCFIGGQSIILPGVTIGDGCVIAAGSVVTQDVPSRTIVAGNPAKVVRTDIEVGPYGRFANADETERNLRASDPDVAALPSGLLD